MIIGQFIAATSGIIVGYIITSIYYSNKLEAASELNIELNNKLIAKENKGENNE